MLGTKGACSGLLRAHEQLPVRMKSSAQFCNSGSMFSDCDFVLGYKVHTWAVPSACAITKSARLCCVLLSSP